MTKVASIKLKCGRAAVGDFFKCPRLAQGDCVFERNRPSARARLVGAGIVLLAAFWLAAVRPHLGGTDLLDFVLGGAFLVFGLWGMLGTETRLHNLDTGLALISLTLFSFPLRLTARTRGRLLPVKLDPGRPLPVPASVSQLQKFNQYTMSQAIDVVRAAVMALLAEGLAQVHVVEEYRALFGAELAKARDVYILSATEKGGLQQAAIKHPFRVGEIYRNRQGQYEVVKLDDMRRSMIIRYLDNEGEFETSIERQFQIWQNTSREDQLSLAFRLGFRLGLLRIWQSTSREDQPGAKTSAAETARAHGNLENKILHVLKTWHNPPKGISWLQDAILFEVRWPHGPSLYELVRAIYDYGVSSPEKWLVSIVTREAMTRGLGQKKGSLRPEFVLNEAYYNRVLTAREQVSAWRTQLGRQQPAFHGALEEETKKAINSRRKRSRGGGSH